MSRALPLIALCAACSLRAPRITESVPCSSSLECGRSDICFLGECRPHAASLALVSAEVRPPNDSPFGQLQVANIDLHASALNDFMLQPLFMGNGTVSQDPDLPGSATPVPGASVMFTQHPAVIPDRVELFPGVTGSGGAFLVWLPQGMWNVLVVPPGPLPPYRPATLDTAASPSLDYHLPKVTSLVPVYGGVTATDGTPLAGASITAVDSAGQALSAASLIAADGGYSLSLPPNTSTYYLQVGPATDADGGLAPQALDPLPSYGQLDAGVAVQVPLPPEIVVQGVVLDSTDTPVAAARVYARSDGMPWNLSRSTTSSSLGVYALSLRAGTYAIEAAPSTDSNAPAVSGEQKFPFSADTSLDLRCPRKVRRFGQVITPAGRAVGANYQITATRMADDLITTRTAFTTPTAPDGIYHVIADPGRYRFEVVPPADTGLPRKIIQFDLNDDGRDFETVLPTIAISAPLSAVGTVLGRPPGGSNAPVPGATVSFFSLDASGQHGLFLGSALTDAQGRYQAVLPDVAQPGP